MPFSGIAAGGLAVGVVLAYAGITGRSVLTAVQAVIQGKSPATAPTTADPIPTGATAATSSLGAAGTAVAAGSNEAVLQQVAATFGWTSANGEWQALNNIEMAEDGYNLTQYNTQGSGAYGEAQFIDGPSEYAEYGGNATTAQGQAIAMCNYIKQRYGTPIIAWAFHQANGYY